MAVLSPPFALGATGQSLSGRLLRLSLGAVWRPATAPLGAVSGILYGAPGTMGEATLVNPTTLNVNPFLAVVQGTHSADQGQYVVPNDAVAALTITGQHASQFRRSLWMVSVADSQAAGVASSGTTDRAWLQLVDGPLSATSPAPLPTVPANSLPLGEVAIPPVGQTVTITPYNPRTGTRGGILPVLDDTSTITGHAGAASAYDGQYRDHPVYGLQRGSGGAWGDPILDQVLTPTFSAPFVDSTGGGYDGLRIHKYGKRCLVAGSYQYTGGGTSAGGVFATLPTGVTPTGITTAPCTYSTGAAWQTGMTIVNPDRTLTLVILGAGLGNTVAGGRVNVQHEFRSTT